MDRIFYTRTIKGIKSALESMPGELDELYREALVRIQNQAGNDGELGMRILSWITHAKRPLSVDELRYGLAVEYSDVPEHLDEFDEENLLSPENLVDVCAGLVIIDSKSQVVRLVHYTTQEYLEKERMQFFKGAEADISRACLTYLSYHYKEIAKSLIKLHPFLDYACHYWFSHAKNVLLSEDPDPRFVKALAYLKSSDSIGWSVSLLWLLLDGSHFFWPDPRDRNQEAYPYEVASRLGVEDLLHVLLDCRIEPYPSLDSSLVLASSFGRLNVARLLLRKGAAMDVKLSPIYGTPTRRSALEGACEGGHLAVAELLIDNGADIHGRDTARDPPIHAAAGSNNLAIINLLLRKGVNVNARNSRGETACHAAVMNDIIESTRRLIDANCDLELRDDDGNTVLLVCKLSTNPKIIDMLLGRGADACAKNKEGKTLRSIIEVKLGRTVNYFGNARRDALRNVEMLRQAEQKLSTTAMDDSQQTEPTSSDQRISRAWNI